MHARLPMTLPCPLYHDFREHTESRKRAQRAERAQPRKSEARSASLDMIGGWSGKRTSAQPLSFIAKAHMKQRAERISIIRMGLRSGLILII